MAALQLLAEVRASLMTGELFTYQLIQIFEFKTFAPLKILVDKISCLWQPIRTFDENLPEHIGLDLADGVGRASDTPE